VALDDRDSTADAQLHLVRVLGGKALPRAGEDLSKLDEASRVLRDQRRKAIAKEWPAIAEALGATFEELFQEYAGRSSLPSGGTGADARAFLRQLKSKGKLPDKLTVVADGLRGWPMRMARLREKRGVAVAIRVPGVGVKVWTVGLPGRNR